MKTLAKCTLVLAMMTGAGQVVAQSVSAAPHYGQAITLSEAQRIADRAVTAAAARGFTMAVAIVDPHGEMMVFQRMDDTQYGSNGVALQKARTAATFKRPTKAFFDALAGGRMAVLSTPGVIAVEGGIPIVVEGRVVGAIGVSGGSAIEDGEIATAALARVP